MATTAESAVVDSRSALGRQRVLGVAAAFLAVAAGIHLLAAPEQLRVWWPAGVFLLVIAAGQGWLADSLLRRPAPFTLLASIWSSVAVIGVYVWSRTAGLPFGPVHHAAVHTHGASQAGHAVGGHGNGVPVYPNAATPSSVESVGALDLAALAAELALIGLLVYLLPARQRRWSGNAILVCGLTMLALRAAGALS